MATPASDEWWSNETVAVVAGARSEIGYEIAKTLAGKGIKVILTTRDEGSGKKLVDQFQEQYGLQVSSHPLNITEHESVDKFVSWVEQEFKAVDILVNSVGLLLSPTQHNLAEALPVVEVNYRGPKRLIKAMIPIMKSSPNGARIVNISGLAARLDILHNEWREKLADDENLTEDVVDEFVEAYLDDVKNGEQFEKGWPSAFSRMDYCVAKMALNSYSRVLAKDLDKREARCKIYINCTSPGHTISKMSGNTGHSVAVGINTAIWLAVMPVGQAVNGKYLVKKQDVGFFEIPLSHHDELIYDVNDIIAHLQKKSSYHRHNSS